MKEQKPKRGLSHNITVFIVLALLIFGVGFAIGTNVGIRMARQKQEQMIIETYHRIVQEETPTTEA